MSSVLLSIDKRKFIKHSGLYYNIVTFYECSHMYKCINCCINLSIIMRHYEYFITLYENVYKASWIFCYCVSKVKWVKCYHYGNLFFTLPLLSFSLPLFCSSPLLRKSHKKKNSCYFCLVFPCLCLCAWLEIHPCRVMRLRWEAQECNYFHLHASEGQLCICLYAPPPPPHTHTHRDSSDDPLAIGLRR